MSKKLVVCLDGTWNDADSEKAETNVALMARAIRATPNKDTAESQIVLYLRGVGTAGLRVQRILEGATGLGLDDTIRSAYMFIAQNYMPGDQLYLFGFSRGAFSARSLAGLIGSCGILRRERLSDLGKAWAFYKSEGERTPKLFVEKTGTQTHENAKIEFLGVWDTVGALGIPSGVFSSINNREYGFHNTSPSSITKHAYHALAIDEFRDEFVPTLWTGQEPPGCKIQQVWFAGAHSDVGGGYVDRKLANIPLLWMAEKAKECGLVLDEDMLKNYGSDPMAPHHDSRSGWSNKDRISPTIRGVCETDFPVSPRETLYRPTENDQILPTINEFVHESVFQRFGKKAKFSTNDEKEGSESRDYAPRNIAPFIEGGKPNALARIYPILAK